MGWNEKDGEKEGGWKRKLWMEKVEMKREGKSGKVGVFGGNKE